MQITTTVFGCGHTTTRETWSLTDETVADTDWQRCPDCVSTLGRLPLPADAPLWMRAGRPNAGTFAAAVAQDQEATRLERERAEFMRQLAATPEAERPFATQAPVVERGGPTLDDLAAED